VLSSRSPRDAEALRLLGTYGFLTPVQIAEFVLGESTLSAESREVVTRRILRRLRERQLVTTNAALAGDPEGMPTRIAYFLTARGQRVFETLEPVARHRRLRVRGTFLLAHALMVAEIALVFVRQARASLGRDVLLWECDWQVASCASFASLAPRGGPPGYPPLVCHRFALPRAPSQLFGSSCFRERLVALERSQRCAKRAIPRSRDRNQAPLDSFRDPGKKSPGTPGEQGVPGQ
jgi:hypothetical protein